MTKREATKREVMLVNHIVDRAMTLAREADVEADRVSLVIGVMMAHRAIPLDLEMLAYIDDVNLAHDVFGIMRHLNPKTGQFEDCFVPRTAKFQHIGG